MNSINAAATGIDIHFASPADGSEVTRRDDIDKYFGVKH